MCALKKKKNPERKAQYKTKIILFVEIQEGLLAHNQGEKKLMEGDYVQHKKNISGKDRTGRMKNRTIFRTQARLRKDELYIRFKDKHRNIRIEK